MNNELLEIIRIANREFQEFIDHVAQNDSKVVESPGAVRRLDKVDLRLKYVSKFLAADSSSSLQAPEAACEVLTYRETLKTLRSVMETLHCSFLSDKARLEGVRANLQGACAWATALREIS